jgi:translocation and assembly module TamB
VSHSDALPLGSGMTRQRIAAITAGSIAGVIVILFIAGVIVVQSPWFRNYVRSIILGSVERATGGRPEVGSFDLDARHLRAVLHDVVIHGNERAGQAPLFRASLILLNMIPASPSQGYMKFSYVLLEDPQLNIIVYPNGETNIPKPKIPQIPSLANVVNLAVNRFDIRNGSFTFDQRTKKFQASGRNLQAHVDYNTAQPGYSGQIEIEPLTLQYANNPAVPVNVYLPVSIHRNVLTIENGLLRTPRSTVSVSGNLSDLPSAPRATIRINAALALQDLRNGLGLELPLVTGKAPEVARANLTLNVGPNGILIQSGRIDIGSSHIDVSGTLPRAQRSGSLTFDARLALAQLGQLFLPSVHPTGILQARGIALIGPDAMYRVSADVSARNAQATVNKTRVSGVNLNAVLVAVPKRVEISDLRLSAAGGTLTGKATITSGQDLEFAGNLRSFALRDLSAILGLKEAAYSGVVSGTVRLGANLRQISRARGEGSFNIARAPGPIPVSGQIRVTYNGSAGALDFGRSYLNLPASRIELAGSLGRQIAIHAVSRNLHDLAPLVPSLPVDLNPGGSAMIDAAIRGSLKAPQVTGHVAVNNFSYQGRSFTTLSGDVNATPFEVAVTNALLTRGNLHAKFSATLPLQNWKLNTTRSMTAQAAISGADAQDVLALAGVGGLPLRGLVALTADLYGSIGNPQGTIQFAVTAGGMDSIPFDRMTARVVLDATAISVNDFVLETGGSRVTAALAYQHPMGDLKQGTLSAHVSGSQVRLADFQNGWKDGPGLQGTLAINAGFRAAILPRNGNESVQVSDVNGNFAVRGLALNGQSLGDITASVSTAANAVQYTLTSNFGGTTFKANGRTLLGGDMETSAAVSIHGLPIHAALAAAGRGGLPITGTLSADAQLSGPLSDPHVTATLAVRNGSAYQQQFDALDAAINYKGQSVDVPSLRVTAGPSTLRVAGSFTHPPGNFQLGDIRFEAQTNGVNLANLHALWPAVPMTGTAQLSVSGAAALRPHTYPVLSTLNGEVEARNLAVNGNPLGRLNLTANTAGGEIGLRLVADLAGANGRGAATVVPGNAYMTTASLNFTDLTYSALQPFLDGGVPAGIGAKASGALTLSGPLVRPAELMGELRINPLTIYSIAAPGGVQPRANFESRNSGPVLVTIAKGAATLHPVRLQGSYEDLLFSGTAGLVGPHTLNIQTSGKLDLSMLQAFNPDVLASGSMVVNAAVRGTVERPSLEGVASLEKANLNLLNLPSGISNATGTIRFSGTDAVIQNLTGELGGGKVGISGFISYARPQVTFRLETAIDHARVQYPENMSTEASARLTLSGSSARSLLSGNVTIFDVALFFRSDIGSLLNWAAASPSPSTDETGLLRNMRFDVRIQTAPNTQLRTRLTEDVQLVADLRLRGDWIQPGMLGNINLTEGDVTFFGTRYTLSRGAINFFDPNRIWPNLNVNLQTRVQGIEIAISVSGPMDRLKLAYHSDPPLRFQDVVSLLATGGSSITDPVLAARQTPVPVQGNNQIGASALLGQTVASPVAGRLQRLFGVTQLRIDPNLSSGTNTPQAAVTLQQQISPELNFTYIQDVARSNQQAVRVEWSISQEWSAVAQREYNGSVDLYLFYRTRFR